MSSTLIIPAKHLFEITSHDEVLLNELIQPETYFIAQMMYTDDNEYIPSGEVIPVTAYSITLEDGSSIQLDLLTEFKSDPIHGVKEEVVSTFNYSGFHKTCIEIANLLGLPDSQFDIV